MDWYYRIIRTDIKYEVDKLAMVARVDVNKPERFIEGDDKTTIEGLAQFLTTAGYYVIVRYKR